MMALATSKNILGCELWFSHEEANGNVLLLSIALPFNVILLFVSQVTCNCERRSITHRDFVRLPAKVSTLIL